MRCQLLFLLVCLVALGLGCGLGATAVATPLSNPSPKTTDTELPQIEPALTLLGQQAQVPTGAASTSPPQTASADLGSICLAAFVDQNGNMVQDATERPLPGVRFLVRHDLVELESFLRTADDDALCIGELPVGDYVVSTVPPMGYSPVSPAEVEIVLRAGESVQVTIGFAETGRPDGLVDLNGRDVWGAVLRGDVEGEKLYLVGADSLYASSDGGESWDLIGSAPPAQGLVVSPADSSIMFAGDSLQCFQGGPPTPLHVSYDGGISWFAPSTGIGLWPATAHWSDAATAWAIGCDGPYVTQDSGLTWHLQPAEFWGLYVLESMLQLNDYPSILYAWGNSEGGSGAVFRSNDRGHTWQLATDELDLWIEALVANSGDAEEVWFATPAGVWHSTDGGNTWDVSTSGLDDVVVGEDYVFEGKGLHALARSDSGSLYLGSEKGVFESDDDGISWRRLYGAPWAYDTVDQLLVSDFWPTPRIWVRTASGVYLFTPAPH